MAWSAPITFVSGNVLTAAQMNTYVRDNTNFLHDPPGCQISRTTNQNITSGTGVTALTLGTIVYDTDSMTGTANQISVSTSGVYHFSLNVEWALQSGGTRTCLIIRQSGGNILGTSLIAPGGTAAANSASADGVFVGGADGGVPQVWQNSGSTVAVLGTGSTSNIGSFNAGLNFSAHWVGAG